MRLPALLLSLFLLAGGALGPALAQSPQQKPPSPEDMKRIMDATMGAMVPVMGRMTEVMIEAQLSAAEQPGTAERIASFKFNLYQALLKKGFSAEQALQITVATSPPSAAPAVK
jgi:hypothetical protein